MIFLHVSEMFKYSNDQKIIQYIALNYLLETWVPKVCSSSSVFLIRNILYVISYNLVTRLDIENSICFYCKLAT